MTAMLMLDLDGKDGLADFLERIWIIKGFGLLVRQVMAYETKNGYHLLLICDNTELDPFTQCFMQLILGSDWKKEAFNYFKIKANAKDWNVLFSKKAILDKVGHEIIVSEEKYSPSLSKAIYTAIISGYE